MIYEHRNFITARSALVRHINSPKAGRITVVIGPSGVGKTTLRQGVMRQFHGDPLRWHLGQLPCAEVTAKLPTNAYFSSKGLAKRSEEQLFMPNLDWLDIDNRPLTKGVDSIFQSVANSRELWKTMPPARDVEADIWESFAKGASDRGIELFSIEHASALCINHKDKTAAQHIWNLMSIAVEAKLTLLLTTVPNGHLLWKDRPEIRRRIDVVWVAPYDDRKREDHEPYLKLLKSICLRYRFEPADLPGRMSNDIAAATACIYGEIEALLDSALGLAISNGRKVIRKADIENAIYNDDDLAAMWKQVNIFRAARIADSSKSIAKIKKGMWTK